MNWIIVGLVSLASFQARASELETYSVFYEKAPMLLKFEKLRQGLSLKVVENLMEMRETEIQKVDGAPNESVHIWSDGRDRIKAKFRDNRLITFEGFIQGMSLRVN